MKKFIVKYAVSALTVGALCVASPSFAQDAGAEVKASVAAVQADTANWREVDPENLIIFSTTKGRVLIEAYPEVAPKHTAQYKAIVRSGDYDGTPFHRVIDGFMAQGGDIATFHNRARETGFSNIEAEFTFRRNPAEMKFDLIGNADKSLQGYYKGIPVRTESAWLAEIVKDGKVESHVPHCAGVVSAARLGNDVNSANAQFFLMRAHSESLDKQYTAWGRIVDGQKAPDTMRTGDPQVVDPDILTEAKMAADLPDSERPRVWVQRTDGPLFKAELAAAIGQDVCSRAAVPTVVQN